MLYRNYTLSVYGYLGRGNRIEIPSYVLDLICNLHPDPEGEYMGHKDAENDFQDRQ